VNILVILWRWRGGKWCGVVPGIGVDTPLTLSRLGEVPGIGVVPAMKEGGCVCVWGGSGPAKGR
jgi:hypothetical protein